MLGNVVAASLHRLSPDQSRETAGCHSRVLDSKTRGREAGSQEEAIVDVL